MWIDNKKKKGSSIHEFEHGYSATSCYWSPQGDMLATTSYDDYIRLFSLDKNGEMELKSAIKHNNHTGRLVFVVE
jgi:WD40 repeat protein